MSHRRLRALLLAAAAPALSAFGQTSDTWGVNVGTAGGSWSVASNWAHGTVPDNGGTATFVALPFSTAPLAIFQDTSTVSLSQIDFLTQITYQVRPPTASPTNSITLTGDAVLNTPIPSINTLSTTSFGQLMQIPIAGSAGLVKRGPGTVSLWGSIGSIALSSSYTGGTRVEDGVLVLRQFGDGGLGDPAGSVTFDGGTIRITTAAWNSNRTIRLAAGGGTVETTTTGTTTFNGAVVGAGALNKTGSRGLTLTASNNYSGATNLLAGSIGLSGNGAITLTSSITARDSLVMDNSGTNSSNRINDTAPVTLQGASVTYTGNASAGSGETLGDVTFSRGTTTVTITPGAGQTAAIQTGAAARDTGAVVFFRGTSLGAAPAPNTGNLYFQAAPTMIGGSGGAGSTDIKIIPWAIGNTSSTASLTSATNTFCTYDVGGVRPLDPTTEYSNSIVSGAHTATNVRLTGSMAVTSSSTINSLIVAAGTDLSGAGSLAITSGALMNLASGFIVSAPLQFGSTEAMIFAQASTNFTGPIDGSGGLTKQGAGAATFAAANTYTGTTIIGGGTAVFTSSVPSGAASAFGNSTTAVQLAPAGLGTGGTTARLVYSGTGSATFDRDLTVTGRIALNNSATPPGFGLTTATTLTVNGSITLDASPLILIGTSGSTLDLAGDISGDGPITDQSTGSGTIRLSGDNDFTGGAEMSGATWQIGSDSALGTGGLLKMVQTSGQPTLQSVGGPHTISNPAVSFSFNANYWQISGSEDLTFTGSINLSGSYTHNINNTGLTTYAGTLHTGGFTKAGTGVLVLSGDNIYTGSTTISSGILRITSDNALGSPLAPTIVNNNAVLELRDGAMTAEPVTITGGGTSSLGAIYSSDGTNSLGNITVAAAATINVAAGELTVGNVDGAAQSFFKAGASELTADRLRVGTLTFSGPVSVMLGRSTSRTSVMNSLSPSVGAKLDLGDNDLVIDYAAPSPISSVGLLLQGGYNGGSWNGAGIASAAAAMTSNTALGYAEATDLFTTFPASFSGQSVDDSSILVRYTLYGDANLDGTANIGDFSLLASNFNQPGRWFSGDFNYDGTTNIGDFSLLAANFNQVLPTEGVGSRAVPEPGAAALMALLAALPTSRRRGVLR